MGEEAIGLAVAGVAEVIKLLIMANNSAVKAGMTPEQFKAVADAVNAGFDMRDPAKLPNKGGAA